MRDELVSAGPASPEAPGVLPSLEVFCTDGGCLQLEEDWHTGLGWWRVDGTHRTRRLSVSEAIESVPHGLAHEVLVEAELLVEQLELDGAYDSAESGLLSAVGDLQGEVALARTAYRDDPHIVGVHPVDRLSMESLRGHRSRGRGL